MTEPREKLSATQVRDAGLADWRQILGRIRARFRTGDFRTGLALVDRIGAEAEAANHHPDVQLTYSDVIVTLVSHDVQGITQRDLDLARAISERAAGMGLAVDTGGLTQLELGLDTAAGERLAPFYAALLGGEVRGGEPLACLGPAEQPGLEQP
jgi:4a-hydroxytetrahydrobiopterin dehydratase